MSNTNNYISLVDVDGNERHVRVFKSLIEEQTNGLKVPNGVGC
jgi:hypothetical protein